MAKRKLKKMMGSISSPSVQALMKLIETQSKETLVNWTERYAREFMLPIHEKAYPEDGRLHAAFKASKDWLDGKVKLPEVKQLILECHEAAREAEENPAAQAAARACGQAASIIHTATHALGIAFYGSAAVAYDKLGLNAGAEEYEKAAEEEIEKILTSLRAVAVENEPNPVKVNWNC